MGSGTKSVCESYYGPQRSLSLASRLYVLLRDELGLGRQPKVARLLVDEILQVVESTLVATEHMRPGQVLLLAPEIGQGSSWRHSTLADKRLKPVRLTLIADDDIERLAAGEPMSTVRCARLVRLVREAFDQGAPLSSFQLALLTGVCSSRVNQQLKTYMETTGETLPTRGIVEDCSPAVTHKAAIIARHLDGESTSEIARATSHTPASVERYIARFEQVRELVRYLDPTPEARLIARILGCSRALVAAYLELLPPGERASTRQGHRRAACGAEAWR
jgi:hypothetical protein